VGDNGTGKTHVLKLGYLFCKGVPDLMSSLLPLNKQKADAYLDEKLSQLFRVSDLGSLIRRGQKSGTKLSADITGPTPFVSPGLSDSMPWVIDLKRPKDKPVKVDSETIPNGAVINASPPRPIFVPSKEIVSLFKGLISLFETYKEFPLDVTYRDLAVALSTLEPREKSLLSSDVIGRIQQLLGGELKLENSDLVFVRDDGSSLEAQLMAEGHRKLALLIYLLRYGVLEAGSTLFWDEPEANLNPAAIKLLAEALFVLSKSGVQVILATHSLFLLREFEILQIKSPNPETCKPRYFALGLRKPGVEVTQSDDLADIDPLLLLDENLLQSDRYLEAGE
jgi:hypothetical protein